MNLSRYISLIIALHFVIMTQAQVTIKSEDVLVLNTAITNAFDTTSPDLDLGSTGNGQIWDFSNVNEVETEKDSVQKISGTYGESYFSTSNYAIDEGDSGYVYISKSASELIINGFSNLEPGGDTSHQRYDMTIITFPSSLGTKFDEEATPYEWETDLLYDPDSSGPHPFVERIGLISHTYVSSEMDAEGTLKSKAKEYNDVLRQYFVTTTVDSVFMFVNGKWTMISDVMASFFGIDSISYDTTYTYRFWSKSEVFPIVEIDYDPWVDSVIELQWIKEIKVGLDDLTLDDTQLKLYPNPATEFITVESDLLLDSYEIVDINGQLMETKRFHGNQQIPVDHLARGNYLISIRNPDGRLISRQMIQVIK